MCIKCIKSNNETKIAEEMLKEGIAPEDIELAISAFRELRTKNNATNITEPKSNNLTTRTIKLHQVSNN